MIMRIKLFILSTLFLSPLSLAAETLINDPEDGAPPLIVPTSTATTKAVPKNLSISQMGKLGRDLKLLQFRQKGLNLELFQFGADVEVLYTYANNVAHAFDKEDPVADDEDIDIVNLRAYFVVSPSDWIVATGTYKFDTTTNFNHMMETAAEQDLKNWQDLFISVGNLNQSPYYATVGKQYIPFGSFRKLSAYTNPLTKTVFRMNADAITLGRDKENMNTLFSVYKAKDHHLSFIVQNNYLFNLGKITKANVGVGFSSDIANMSSAIEKSVVAKGNKPLPAFDAFAEWSLGKFAFKTEINQTLVNSQNNQKFGAWALEGQYAFHFWQPSAITTGYSMLYNAEDVFDSSLPKRQWVSSYKVQLPWNVYAGLEYVRGTTFGYRAYNEINVDVTVKF